MKIPWTDKVSNEEVPARVGVQRKMIRQMVIRQLKFMKRRPRKFCFDRENYGKKE